MSKSDNEEVLEGRVRSLKDVVEIKFQSEEGEGAEKSGRASPKGPKWVCPITNKALGPGVKAVYLVPCGHAFLESAIREVSGENCLQVSSQTSAFYGGSDVFSVQRTIHCRQCYSNITEFVYRTRASCISSKEA